MLNQGSRWVLEQSIPPLPHLPLLTGWQMFSVPSCPGSLWGWEAQDEESSKAHGSVICTSWHLRDICGSAECAHCPLFPAFFHSPPHALGWSPTEREGRDPTPPPKTKAPGTRPAALLPQLPISKASAVMSTVLQSPGPSLAVSSMWRAQSKCGRWLWVDLGDLLPLALSS